MLFHLCKPSNQQLSQEMSAQDGKEVAHVHRHDSQHPRSIVRFQAFTCISLSLTVNNPSQPWRWRRLPGADRQWISRGPPHDAFSWRPWHAPQLRAVWSMSRSSHRCRGRSSRILLASHARWHTSGSARCLASDARVCAFRLEGPGTERRKWWETDRCRRMSWYWLVSRQ